MLFSSIPFLYYFLPLVLAVYFLTPARFRNAVLLLASLIFYAWGEPKYVLLMLASILSGYGFGLLQERYRGQKGAKLFCGLSVAVSLSFLLYFKYADFFLENFNAATGLGVPLLRIALPSMLAQFVSVLYSIVDRMYIGNIAEVGDIALAGVGVCGPVVTMVGSVAFLIGVGGAPLMSIKLGEGDPRGAKSIMANCFGDAVRRVRAADGPCPAPGPAHAAGLRRVCGHAALCPVLLYHVSAGHALCPAGHGAEPS